MSSQEYQGGPFCELLSCHNTKAAGKWIASGTVNKDYDKDAKSYVLCLDGRLTGHVHIPSAETRASLRVTQPYLVLQLKLQAGVKFSLELNITDNTASRRRLHLSTATRACRVDTLHTRLSLSEAITGEWISLCLDLEDIIHACYQTKFRCLDSVTIDPVCWLRKVFTTKLLPEDTSEQAGTFVYATEPAPLPTRCRFPAGCNATTQVFTMARLQAPQVVDIATPAAIPSLEDGKSHTQGSRAAVPRPPSGSAAARVQAGGDVKTPSSPRQARYTTANRVRSGPRSSTARGRQAASTVDDIPTLLPSSGFVDGCTEVMASSCHATRSDINSIAATKRREVGHVATDSNSNDNSRIEPPMFVFSAPPRTPPNFQFAHHSRRSQMSPRNMDDDFLGGSWGRDDFVDFKRDHATGAASPHSLRSPSIVGADASAGVIAASAGAVAAADIATERISSTVVEFPESAAFIEVGGIESDLSDGARSLSPPMSLAGSRLLLSSKHSHPFSNEGISEPAQRACTPLQAAGFAVADDEFMANEDWRNAASSSDEEVINDHPPFSGTRAGAVSSKGLPRVSVSSRTGAMRHRDRTVMALSMDFGESTVGLADFSSEDGDGEFPEDLMSPLFAMVTADENVATTENAIEESTEPDVFSSSSYQDGRHTAHDKQRGSGNLSPPVRLPTANQRQGSLGEQIAITDFPTNFGSEAGPSLSPRGSTEVILGNGTVPDAGFGSGGTESSGDACDSPLQGDNNMLDLVYDPVLNCYFDPGTNKYYELL